MSVSLLEAWDRYIPSSNEAKPLYREGGNPAPSLVELNDARKRNHVLSTIKDHDGREYTPDDFIHRNLQLQHDLQMSSGMRQDDKLYWVSARGLSRDISTEPELGYTFEYEKKTFEIVFCGTSGLPKNATSRRTGCVLLRRSI